MTNMKTKTLHTIIGILSLFTTSLACAGLAAAEEATLTNLRKVLGAYEVPYTVGALMEFGGGRESFIEHLLELRQDRTTPFVAGRATQLLLRFTSDEQVMLALEEDLRNPLSKGNAVEIITHLESVPSQSRRLQLAKVSVLRAQEDSSLLPYARLLQMNSDGQIKDLAKTLPAND